MKILLILIAFTSFLTAQDRPNILWITSEDNSSHWLGCYGNEQAKTPNLDALAKQGTRFTNAYSNAPVCAVARGTILTGVYAATMGTQHMRSRHPIPERYKPNVHYLRNAGYYCTNNNKTDYNFKGNDNSYWDDSSNKAHYKNRPDGKPFFAIFNITDSHESSLFANKPAEPQRLKPEEINLPPYLPDLPEIRKDAARYHDRITDMDTQVGKILNELEKSGQAENTIVIYYADHGGILPRGKRYLEQTGVNIPFIIRIPEKFQSLSPFKPGQVSPEPVSFIDLSPTILSLAGLETPKHMQGRPLLGTHRKEPAADEVEFLFADRFDEIYGMRRGITDGKWKYIRNFNPHLPQAPYSYYQFGQPGWQAYQKAWKEGKLSGYHKAQFEPPTTSEFLFDLTVDPWEINNLATDPAHSAKLIELRAQLKTTMLEAHDTGLVPEPMFEKLADKTTIADLVQDETFDLKGIIDIAFTATANDAEELPTLVKSLESDDPVKRYWALIGLITLGEKAEREADHAAFLLKDPHRIIGHTAAELLFQSGYKPLATSVLVTEISQDLDSSSLLYLLNTLERLDLIEELPADWHKDKSFKMGNEEYINRFVKRKGEN